MHAFVSANLEHVLFVAILIARISDAGTTYLATPKFKLEANPLVRRFKIPAIIASLALSLLPYLSIKAAIIILVVSLLVSVSNSLRLWLVLAVGEEQYFQFLLRAAAKANYRLSLILNMLPGLIMLFFALVLYLFYPNPEKDMGFYFALGVATYGMMIMINFPRSFVRARREGLEQGRMEVEK